MLRNLSILLVLSVLGSNVHTAADDEDSIGPWDVIESPSVQYTEPDTALSSAEAAMMILGEPRVDAETMWRFVNKVNPDFPIEIARAYIEVGRRYGIRGDIALCQAVIETGWFRFADGTAVRPEQHNYCGLGVEKRGMTGCSFSSIEEGVTAQLQHLYAYAADTPLPDGEKIVDPRFKLVKRGCAQSWHDLSGRWAMNDRYGIQILSLYQRLLESADGRQN
jgi:cell wall hydrolase/autolysin